MSWLNFLNHVPVVGQVKGFVHLAARDQEGFEKARKDAITATSYVPILGHIQAAAAAAIPKEKRDNDPALGENFIQRNLTRSSATTVGMAATMATGGLAIAGAGAAASTMGIAGVTGGVASGALGAAGAGVVGGVAGTAVQHGVSAGLQDEDEIPSAQDYVTGAVAGGVGGLVGGSAWGKTAKMVPRVAGPPPPSGIAKGGLATGPLKALANKAGVHGVERAALKGGVGAAISKAGSTVSTLVANEVSTGPIEITVTMPDGTVWKIKVNQHETVRVVFDRVKSRSAKVRGLSYKGQNLDLGRTLVSYGIQEGDILLCR